MRILSEVLIWLTYVFIAFLFGRMIVSWVIVFAREWRPRGAAAAALEVIYSTTDPPLRLLGRLIPPLRVGNVAIDLAFIVLFVLCYALLSAWSALGGVTF